MKISLTQNKWAEFLYADLDRIKSHKWFYDGGYASTVINHKKISMHRFLMEAPSNMEVDHKDGDKLNNKRDNLRLCTRKENAKNRSLNSNNVSGFSGVHFTNSEKRRKRWVASIRVNGKKTSLGRFFTKEEAVRVREEAEKKYYGEYRRK